jgi:hypothetical protein
MSTFKNADQAIIPVREMRTLPGIVALASLGAQVEFDVNGDESAVIQFDGGGGTLNATYAIEGSIDGATFQPIPMYPLPAFCSGGVIPLAAQPMFLEAVNAASIKRAVVVSCGQLKKIKVRFAGWVAGSANVMVNSDSVQSLSPYARDQRAATLMVTATAAVGVAATATLPAVAGLRHYVDFVQVSKFNGLALTVGTVPVLVTSTNIPGTPVINFPAPAEAQGLETVRDMDFGGQGMATIAIGTSTTIVCPATPGVIWRVNVAYRLGL